MPRGFVVRDLTNLRKPEPAIAQHDNGTGGDALTP
jgi:hypothetical protein